MKEIKDFLNGWRAIIQDFIAFITDPDARIASEFKYPSGRYMSVRDAKKSGLL